MFAYTDITHFEACKIIYTSIKDKFVTKDSSQNKYSLKDWVDNQILKVIKVSYGNCHKLKETNFDNSKTFPK